MNLLVRSVARTGGLEDVLDRQVDTGPADDGSWRDLGRLRNRRAPLGSAVQHEEERLHPIRGEQPEAVQIDAREAEIPRHHHEAPWLRLPEVVAAEEGAVRVKEGVPVGALAAE